MRFLCSIAVVILFVTMGWCQSDLWHPLWTGELDSILTRPDKIVRLDVEGWTNKLPVFGKRADSLTFWIKVLPLPGKRKEWLAEHELSGSVVYLLKQFAVDYKRNLIRQLVSSMYGFNGEELKRGAYD